MKILTVHADYIEVEARQKAIKDAEKIDEDKKKVRYDEVLVVFTAVENGDTIDLAGELAKEVDNIARQLKVKNILLYPLVHLTNNPSSPNLALKVITGSQEILGGMGYAVSHSPFGWYKGYTLKCKGHPLAELSRELKPNVVGGSGGEDKEESESLKRERKMVSKLYIMDLDGKLFPVKEFNYSKYPNLKKFVSYESEKARVYDKEPPHIRLMKEHDLVQYEPGSDPGNFRFLPKGRLIKSILERKITDLSVDYGAAEVETPIMYDLEHPSLKAYLNRFPARHYVVLSDDKKLFLRFAACFGQFLISHDMVMTYKELPFKMFELTRYSFRREQSGELTGLKRLRAFTMPDMHTMAANMNQAQKAFEEQLGMGLQWNKELAIETEVGFRALREFFDENRDWYVSMVRKVGKPVLFEIFEERYAYFITKFEFNFVDAMNKASALTTVQIDVENADTYDLNYVDKDGQKKRPLILHASLSGSLERVMYALLEREAMRMKEGKKAMLPIWLSPTQVRVIPVAEKHGEFALNLAGRLLGNKIRSDVDETDETLGKRIRNAEKEWVPYIIVVGDKEMESEKYPVSIRADGSRVDMSEAEVIARLNKDNQGQPFAKLSLNMKLSLRPKF